MFNIGEEPGKGTYCCTNCGPQVTLDDDDDRFAALSELQRGAIQALLTSND